mmetsp:Transcript_30578/g.89481  ORF Transcript_30578/g.89481 Transcript_30578/m.89481 type:complete len:210 (+) Transcript_30578:91-720(+)
MRRRASRVPLRHGRPHDHTSTHLGDSSVSGDQRAGAQPTVECRHPGLTSRLAMGSSPPDLEGRVHERPPPRLEARTPLHIVSAATAASTGSTASRRGRRTLEVDSAAIRRPPRGRQTRVHKPLSATPGAQERGGAELRRHWRYHRTWLTVTGNRLGEIPPAVGPGRVMFESARAVPEAPPRRLRGPGGWPEGAWLNSGSACANPGRGRR